MQLGKKEYQRWFGERRPIIEQSPPYPFSKTNFNSNEVWTQNLDNDNATYGYYAPYNYIQISNQTTQSLTLSIADINFIIPVGVIKSFDSETIPAFRSFNVTNGSTGSTGTAEIIIQKVISANESIRLNNGVSPYGK